MKEQASFNEARAMVLQEVQALATEQVRITDALNRTLAEKTVAWVDLPSATVSLRDGYAIRSADSAGANPNNPVRLTVVGHSTAGDPYPEELLQGKAVRITTGGAVPKGADAVVQDEDAIPDADKIVINSVVMAHSLVQSQGEEFHAGQMLASKEELLSPAMIGLLIAGGFADIHVVKRPRVCLIAAGDELRPAGRVLRPGQCYPSTAWALAAMALELGIEEVLVRLCADEEDSLLEALPDPAAIDLVITIGGTGHSEMDITLPALEQAGCDFKFKGVRMSPGRGTAMGLWESNPVICIPGRPAAAEVAFNQFIRPAILKMSGRKDLALPVFNVNLAEDISTDAETCKFIRVVLEITPKGWAARPMPKAGAHLEMARYHGYVVMPEGQKDLKAGSTVPVQLTRLEAIVPGS